MLIAGAARWTACCAAALFLLVPAAAAAAHPPWELQTPVESPQAPAGRSPSTGEGSFQGHPADRDRSVSQAVRLSELQSVSVDGVDHFVFALEPAGSRGDHDGALDVLRLYIADREDILNPEALAMEGDLLLDLLLSRSGGWIAGDTPGRDRAGGRAAYVVPARAFAGIDPDRYLYLHSKYAASSGTSPPAAPSPDEEDASALPRGRGGPRDVAEPATPLLLAAGLLAVGLAGRRPQS